MHRDQGNVGGCNAADPKGLPEASRGVFHEILASLVTQARHGLVIKRLRDELVFQAGESLNLSILTGDVSVVFDLNLG
jgi:hypothetical protein